jgi:CheY-like chemotaxis protein
VRENHDIISDKSKEKGSILIIDSAKYRLNQNVSLLQQTFTVWSANNDDEAIDLLSNRTSHKIDIVLIDLNSDENTAGWGFLSELWRNEEWKDTPVIVLTNSNEVNFNSSLWAVSSLLIFKLFYSLSYRIDCQDFRSDLDSF